MPDVGAGAMAAVASPAAEPVVMLVSGRPG
jgi:hypothetical protein